MQPRPRTFEERKHDELISLANGDDTDSIAAKDYVGWRYFEGKTPGFAKNDGEAEKYLLAAAETGYKKSQYGLGVLYRDTASQKWAPAERMRKLQQAYVWFELAGQNGHPDGFAQAEQLGLSEPEKVAAWELAKKDDHYQAAVAAHWAVVQKHKELLDKARGGDADEMWHVALYMQEGSHGFTKNPDEAEKWGQNAAYAGNLDAQQWMGDAYTNGTIASNNVRAAAWYMVAKANALAAYDATEDTKEKNRLAKIANDLQVKFYALPLDPGQRAEAFKLATKTSAENPAMLRGDAAAAKLKRFGDDFVPQGQSADAAAADTSETSAPAPAAAQTPAAAAERKDKPDNATYNGDKIQLTKKGANVNVAAWQELMNEYEKRNGHADKHIAVDGLWGSETNAEYTKMAAEIGADGMEALKKLKATTHDPKLILHREHFTPPSTPNASDNKAQGK